MIFEMPALDSMFESCLIKPVFIFQSYPIQLGLGVTSSGRGGNAFGTSRGPSPLTLGMSDVIPIAVAFQEVCHSCFRGPDEALCQVRLIGDMMISFPAGIVAILCSNLNAAPLRFRIKNAGELESVIPNKQLITA